MDACKQSRSFPSGPLRERVKELECLQAIVSIIETPGLSSEKIIQGIVNVIPSGWQHPERCRARIKLNKAVFHTPGFVETPWMQRVALRSRGATVGTRSRSVIPNTSLPPRGQRLSPGGEEAHRADRQPPQPPDRGMGKPGRSRRRAASDGPAAKRKSEWRIIMDLLRETDPMLYRRVLRRLMNHLHWQGVPGVQGLLFHLTPEFYAQTEAAPGREPAPAQAERGTPGQGLRGGSLDRFAGLVRRGAVGPDQAVDAPGQARLFHGRHRKAGDFARRDQGDRQPVLPLDQRGRAGPGPGRRPPGPDRPDPPLPQRAARISSGSPAIT